MKKVALHTLGCKLNYAESSAIGERFRGNGFDVVEFGDAPDVVVVNSCTVTQNADRECRQIVRRALRANPEAFVIVTGCYAQLKPEEIASIASASRWPSRMMAPLPNCRSIWVRALSMALCRSDAFVSLMGFVPFVRSPGHHIGS